jgi:3-deoxy-D-manno-octulosonic acid kinase
MANDASAQQALLDWFNPEYWKTRQAITGTSKGRNTTWFFTYNNKEYVLRHYYRGGLIGKLVNDCFLGLNVRSSRPALEVSLLDTIAEKGLPAPAPLAAHIEKVAPFTYRADLIMERVSGAEDVFHILLKRRLTEKEWFHIGETIAKFHSHGVYHDDLNIHNVLLDNADQCWLIDFDKGAIRTPDKSWQQQNLDRLLRSLKKEQGLNETFYWKLADWQSLLTGYYR